MLKTKANERDKAWKQKQMSMKIHNAEQWYTHTHIRWTSTFHTNSHCEKTTVYWKCSNVQMTREFIGWNCRVKYYSLMFFSHSLSPLSLNKFEQPSTVRTQITNSKLLLLQQQQQNSQSKIKTKHWMQWKGAFFPGWVCNQAVLLWIFQNEHLICKLIQISFSFSIWLLERNGHCSFF